LSYVFKITSDESLRKGLIKAAKIISEGGIVAFPTESFYGLGVDATNSHAIKRLFKIKKRDYNVPILVLISSIKNDNALEQTANMTMLPGIVGKAMAMPDIHWGYGFPIGGVAATDAEKRIN